MATILQNYFQMHFLDRKLDFDSKFTNIIIGSGDDFPPNGHQTITWTNDDQIL